MKLTIKKFVKIPVYYTIEEVDNEKILIVDDESMKDDLDFKIRKLVEENNKFLNC